MRTAFLCFVAFSLIGATPQRAGKEQDKVAIERLHHQIIDATLSGQVEQLTDLWDNDGVRLTQGRPAEAGKAAIDADNRSGRAAHPEWKTIYYQPEIKDLDGLYGGEPITGHTILIHVATAGAILFVVACVLSLFSVRFGIICALAACILSWPLFASELYAVIRAWRDRKSVV